MKYNTVIDFHLDCNCFLQISKGTRAQGMDIPGVYFYSDRQGNSGLAMPVVGRVLNAKGQKKVGSIYFNFCPFCGKQIAVNLIKEVKDETATKPDKAS